MRRACTVAVVLLLCACAGQPEDVSQISQCSDPRPLVCTMQYDPTCAVLTDGKRKEYASACNACADDAVRGYDVGPCPE
jgi:hypothetical protein